LGAPRPEEGAKRLDPPSWRGLRLSES